MCVCVSYDDDECDELVPDLAGGEVVAGVQQLTNHISMLQLVSDSQVMICIYNFIGERHCAGKCGVTLVIKLCHSVERFVRQPRLKHSLHGAVLESAGMNLIIQLGVGDHPIPHHTSRHHRNTRSRRNLGSC
jgi:hypothetical protein